jgi:hypothetical protein
MASMFVSPARQHATITAPFTLRHVDGSVLSFGHDHEIARVIVGGVAIDVVDNLFARKGPSEHFFGNDAVLRNVPQLVCGGVIWHMEIDVSGSLMYAAPGALGLPFSAACGGTATGRACLGWRAKKRRAANYTNESDLPRLGVVSTKPRAELPATRFVRGCLEFLTTIGARQSREPLLRGQGLVSNIAFATTKTSLARLVSLDFKIIAAVDADDRNSCTLRGHAMGLLPGPWGADARSAATLPGISFVELYHDGGCA